MRKVIEGLFFVVAPFLIIPPILFRLYLAGVSISDPEFLRHNLIPTGILFLLLIFMIVILVKSFRKLQKGEKIVNFQKPVQAIFYLFSSLTALIILGVSIMFFLSLFTKGNPQIFPLDNSEGEYKITLGCPA